MTGQRLYKREKLCSLKAIDALFGPGSRKDAQCNAVMAFPWRAVWRKNEERPQDCPQFLISIPKKRLKKAVDRVRMRRVMREAYRLNRDLLPPGMKADIVIIYVADHLTTHAAAVKSIMKIFKAISTKANEKDGFHQ